MKPDRRTDYARATAGYDEAFERALVDVITTAIAEASRVTDAPIMVLRTGEIASALLTCLASTLALSPAATRSPTATRKLMDELRRRLLLRIRQGQAEADAFRARVFNGTDVGGAA